MPILILKNNNAMFITRRAELYLSDWWSCWSEMFFSKNDFRDEHNVALIMK